MCPGQFRDSIPISEYRAHGPTVKYLSPEFHPLKGDRKGEWVVSVSGNWRITFEFRDSNAYSLNYEDYH